MMTAKKEVVFPAALASYSPFLDTHLSLKLTLKRYFGIIEMVSALLVIGSIQ